MARHQTVVFIEGDPDRIERQLNKEVNALRRGTITLVSFQPIKLDPLTDFTKALKDSPNRYAVIAVLEGEV